ncbi:CPBP family intramembrane glutamic endopeptidase [Tunicatimonas pelagia]|uniref:CPBP family intramembrane glutamic endopeptidase n=1 Tax=Tunicatimonas pelagia TaxID=931531 RepID=UPI002667054A|nr:type II CAAX endopeptidase family protein [Tunicatimonas pelagia]WKN43649.1 type II CAAX endopeptidase family protein [Tunicatimonas pelagia]
MIQEAPSFNWHPDFLPSVVSIMTLTVCFVTFWFLSESTAIHQRLSTHRNKVSASIAKVVYQKALGALLLGVIPFLIAVFFLRYSVVEYGLGFQNTGTSMLWISGIATVVIPLNIRAAQRPENLDYYPMIRAEKWTWRLVLLNALATITYLFSYEVLFRGILLTACVDTLGVWPGIAVNVALYSTTHLPKGPAETIGAIPFGLLMCYITLTTGTIWVAVVAHVILSLSNDYLAVYYNPNMQFSRK